MYCPNCAAPIDGVKFCRSCGSNVSLIPQAMSGQLPQSEASEGELHLGVRHLGRHHDRKKELSVDHAMTEFFTGIGFVITAIAILIFVPSGVFWWWSFLIPASKLIGAGPFVHYGRNDDHGPTANDQRLMINDRSGILLGRLLDNLSAARLFFPFPQGSASYCKELRHWLKGELPHKV